MFFPTQSFFPKLVAKMDGILADRGGLDVYDVHGRIDDDLREDLREVADARMALVPLYGMQRYADLMTQFASSERYVNRTWSASADGYVDEVWKSFELATAQMKRARGLLSDYQRES